ncbi:hypothetical protein F542_19830 [Bibersteinia trehalosi USDA-ARS-USMARC-188]|uniref:Uncharacterized protein n=2 Tax=Bibersteinia trehalosi TaxID=47735 RepID=A0A4V7ICN1_BIBTR|nr:hypothetical protein WQG_2130 [Bibersteinia trehalosi USDA-ARS-USMARC-192]AHG82692.1 hypothetical protein F542_19830 [Bibersteinia trehalosi USDA-ARS-USMARC-188]AHG85028.1 hypothetical protein F543_21730 [Bibersteinia trehalosi USDA-ARS-USMARC-189]
MFLAQPTSVLTIHNKNKRYILQKNLQNVPLNLKQAIKT